MFLSFDNKIQGFVTDVSYVPYFSQHTSLNMARLKQFSNTHMYIYMYSIKYIFLSICIYSFFSYFYLFIFIFSPSYIF